ncbi:MAG: histidine phosphatase family protein [Reichenbachiella sp.]
MKTLFLVRHAKSSWDFPELSDKERPLNKRGNKNAPAMAKYLNKRIVPPDVIICSPSRRTHETAKYFIKRFGYDQNQIVYKEELYHAYKSDFEGVISQIDNVNESAMLFAHNPGITDYVSELTGQFFDNIPTCGVVSIGLNTDDWRNIGIIKGELNFYYYPKGIKT